MSDPRYLIPKDLCTRCGACFAADTEKILHKDSDGFPIHCSDSDDSNIARLLEVCSGENWNYSQWIKQVHGKQAEYDPSSPDIGIYQSIFLLTSSDSTYREQGQSGGVTTTLLRYGLEENIINAALAVRRPSGNEGNPFSSEPFIVRKTSDLKEAAGSKYTICSTLEMIHQISQESDSFAITTLPCQTVGFHKLATNFDTSLLEKCKIIIGPFCGLNMEATVGEDLARATGINPNKVSRFMNRGGKFPGATTFEMNDGQKFFVDRTAHRVLYRMYAPLRCYTCTDFGNELADVVVADCWERDKSGFKYPEGAAYVICRTQRGKEYVESAIEKGYVDVLPFNETLVKERWKPGFYYRKVRAHNRIRYWLNRNRDVPKLDYPLPPEFTPSRTADQIDMGMWRLFRYKSIRWIFLKWWLHLANSPSGTFRNLIFEDCKKYIFTHNYDQFNKKEFQKSIQRYKNRAKLLLSSVFPKMKKAIKDFLGKNLAKIVKPYLPHPKLLDYKQPTVSNKTLISKAARFVACEMIEGDYMEFGVYQGASYINAYHALKQQFENRISLKVGGQVEDSHQNKRRAISQNMRFIAFDSFEGLPSLEKEDLGTNDFDEGMYACSLDQFKKNIAEAGIPEEKTLAVQGWFKDTCIPETAEKFQLNKASIIWLDADLYSSTKSVLDFITDFLQDGTIIIFDDWFSFKGSPYYGVQKAFYEWSSKPVVADRFLVHEYQREDWKRISFILSEKPTNSSK